MSRPLSFPREDGMRGVIGVAIAVGVLTFLYFEAKARAYRAKMDQMSLDAYLSSRAPEDAAGASFESAPGASDGSVHHDQIDAGGEDMRHLERRSV
jgi:hypothetical protein